MLARAVQLSTMKLDLKPFEQANLAAVRVGLSSCVTKVRIASPFANSIQISSLGQEWQNEAAADGALRLGRAVGLW